MSTLNFKSINKVYDNNVQAVFDFNLDIKDKEFIVFVGPSGCGKSTTLRMIAGLEDITSGELYIDNVLVNNIEPKDRNIAMVFQNYALYPHMTVYKNMAFALELRKVPCAVYSDNEEADLIRVSNKRIMKKARSLRKKTKVTRLENKKNPIKDDIYYLNLRYDLLKFNIVEEYAKQIDIIDLKLKKNQISKEEYKIEVAPIFAKRDAEIAELDKKKSAGFEELKIKDLLRKGKMNQVEYNPADQESYISFEKFDLFNVIDMLYGKIIAEDAKAVKLLQENHIKGIWEEHIKDLDKHIVFTKKDLAFFMKAKEKGGYNEVSTKIIEDGIAQRTSQLAAFEKEKEHYLNTEVPLYKSRKLSKYEIDLEINKAANILDLNKYLLRKPAALSGGQRQRVALGRCIVRNPKVFLMDEPLSNLDAKLRVQTRSEIINIHKKVGATTVYVTHDQTEAMTMADRIVVMKDGYIQQIDVPDVIYSDPANMFVAGFIGNPPMNFLKGKFDGKELIITSEHELENITLQVNEKIKKLLKDFINKPIVVGVRPENIFIEGNGKEKGDQNKIEVKVDFKELLGYEKVIYTKIAEQKFLFKIGKEENVNIDDKVIIGINMDDMYFFDSKTTNRIK